MLLPIITYYCIWRSSLNFHDVKLQVLAYNSWWVAAGIGCKILCHVHSICILWISAQTDFSRRWGISVKACRLPLPWLHTDLFHPLGAGSAHWAPLRLHPWNQMWGPGQHSKAQERAPRPSSHQTGAKGCHLLPFTSPSATKSSCNPQVCNKVQ